LNFVSCTNNQIKELKNLPNTLKYLYCENNQLTELNNLTHRLYTLECENNQLLFTELNKILKLNKFIKFFKITKIINFIFFNLIKKRCSKYKEELIAKVFNPCRIFKCFNNYDDINTYMENI
jgi:Leucine-rich repeat (LRR) protein